MDTEQATSSHSLRVAKFFNQLPFLVYLLLRQVLINLSIVDVALGKDETVE